MILSLVQMKINYVAPNLSTMIGPASAAKLMGLAGGLIMLSKIPACNIQVLGSKRKNLDGFSTKFVQQHHGFVYGCEIVQQTPFAWRDRALKLVSTKCALLSRVDAYR